MSERIRRAEKRFVTAMSILDELRLLERWGRIGNPCIVGAMAYGLQVAPDIDMEIFCDRPTVQAGFALISACVQDPRIRRARYANELDGPDQGIYFQLRYRHESGEDWKLDMWLVANDHPGPLSRDLVEPMRRALTDETREAILSIKEQGLARKAKVPSIDIYRAVLDDHVRTYKEFVAWQQGAKPAGLTFWRPGSK